MAAPSGDRSETLSHFRASDGIRTRIIEPDLFEPRAVAVMQAVRREPDRTPTRRDSSAEQPSLHRLAELAGAGLSLRQIARRVGVSHETVRQRLTAASSTST